MSGVVFYDMPVDARLSWIAKLAERAWQRRKKMLIHCATVEDAQHIDESLWCFREDAFIPHEMIVEGQPLADPEARIVITTVEHDPLKADIFLATSPTPSLDFAANFETVIEIVDHRDDGGLAASRERYRSWKKRGVDVAYKK